MKVIISPYSRSLKNKLPNPKNYPYFPKLIKELKNKGWYIIQIGIDGEEKFEEVDEYQFNLNFQELKQLTLFSDTFISVDNFYPHFCNLINKSGIVIFSQSNPDIFGHKLHINLLKDIKYLKNNQFSTWEETQFNIEAFIPPEIIIQNLVKFF